MTVFYGKRDITRISPPTIFIFLRSKQP